MNFSKMSALGGSLLIGIAAVLSLSLAGCESAAEREALMKVKVQEVDGAAPAQPAMPAGSDSAPHDHAAEPPHGQTVEVETHDHKSDPRLTSPAAAPQAGNAAATVTSGAAQAGSGSAMDAGSGSATEAPEAGSGSSNCTCSKDKPSCQCGHCSGAIGVCHCSHGK